MTCVRSRPEGTSADAPPVSVIVPAARGEAAWPSLLGDLLHQVPPPSEVLVAAADPEPPTFREAAAGLPAARWLTVRPGRAAQMNDAARAASDEFLWFLHADTRLPAGASESLAAALAADPDALHYFGLRFHDGPRRLRLNEVGVGLRCRLLGLPFGDQGFCLRKSLFDRLGGFDEAAPYGEDHLLVWAAKRDGVRLRRVVATLSTSGRKYADRGWTTTTLRHVWLTARQAAPQAVRRSGREVR